MGRLKIKGERRFVQLVTPEPPGAFRRWFVASMFVAGVLSCAAWAIVFAIKVARYLVP